MTKPTLSVLPPANEAALLADGDAALLAADGDAIGEQLMVGTKQQCCRTRTARTR